MASPLRATVVRWFAYYFYHDRLGTPEWWDRESRRCEAQPTTCCSATFTCGTHADSLPPTS